MYTKDDAETWLDYTANHKPPAKVAPPYANEEEREKALRYMAGYYNAILAAGGTVGNVASLNPYVNVWNGATKTYMPADEAVAYGPGSGGGVVAGPYKEPQAPPSVMAPSPASSTPTPAVPSLWQRFLAWLRRLFD